MLRDVLCKLRRAVSMWCSSHVETAVVNSTLAQFVLQNLPQYRPLLIPGAYLERELLRLLAQFYQQLAAQGRDRLAIAADCQKVQAGVQHDGQ